MTPHIWTGLHPTLVEVLQNRGYENPCVAAFEYLVQWHPYDFLAWLANNELPNSSLTYAAEYAKYVKDSEAVRKALVPLLNHPSPLVREGAIVGLEPHLDKELKYRLEEMSENDPSEGVRMAAEDVLKDISWCYVPNNSAEEK